MYREVQCGGHNLYSLVEIAVNLYVVKIWECYGTPGTSDSDRPVKVEAVNRKSMKLDFL